MCTAGIPNPIFGSDFAIRFFLLSLCTCRTRTLLLLQVAEDMSSTCPRSQGVPQLVYSEDA